MLGNRISKTPFLLIVMFAFFGLLINATCTASDLNQDLEPFSFKGQQIQPVDETTAAPAEILGDSKIYTLWKTNEEVSKIVKNQQNPSSNEISMGLLILARTHKELFRSIDYYLRKDGKWSCNNLSPDIFNVSPIDQKGTGSFITTYSGYNSEEASTVRDHLKKCPEFATSHKPWVDTDSLV